MPAMTKAKLEVKRLQKSLERSRGKNEALAKSLERTKKQLATSRKALSEARKKLNACTAELKESAEQQTATAEILRVISSSPTEVQRVFDAIIKSGMPLFGGLDLTLRLVREDELAVAASTLPGDGWVPIPLKDDRFVATKSVHVRGVVQAGDVLVEDWVSEGMRRLAERRGFRAAMAAPLMREGSPIGVMAVTRAMPGLFSDREMNLLKTFADQAVIAIENARLFKELEARNAELTETLQQQTATTEILRVISSSPTDTKPVFDVIAERATQLCDGKFGFVFMFDGEWIDLASLYRLVPESAEAFRKLMPIRPGSHSVAARTVRDGKVIHVPDVQADPEYLFLEASRLAGYRSVLSVPMMREGQIVGGIAVARAEVGLFSDKRVELLQTFASQAVIAIENVRLFRELEARNAALTEALEQQTATSEILGVISQSPTDVAPVFEAIMKSAARLCGGPIAAIYRFDGELVHLAATHNWPAEAMDILASRYPCAPNRAFVGSRVVLERSIVRIPDTLADPDYEPAAPRHWARRIVGVPLMRGETPVGAMVVAWPDPGETPESKVALLKTFADQAVIAIENVRLFKELQTQTEALSRSVNQLTALGEVGQAISSTLEVETVLKTIVSRALQLTGLDSGSIYEYDQQSQVFRLQTTENVPEAITEAARKVPVRWGDGVIGRAGVTREVVQVADILDPSYRSGRRDLLVRAGYRALLAVPLLREEQLLGVLLVSRNVPGEFPPATVDLLKTFATQSTLAIQNARLFREIAQKGQQLEVANRHKSEFLANMSHELRTPLNAVIGFSEVLQQGMVGELNEKQDEYLKYIHASGSHLLSLINDILDLSKVEAGRMELELSSFNVPLAIDNALTLVKERAARHGLTLESEIDPKVADIRADERKFKQILLNLLSNAVKFTPEGGQITVAARPVNDTVEVSVTDTGIGIAPEDCDAVFEEFRQVGRGSHGKSEGTGLGLALTKKFIELHGGKIWLTSAVGRGSTFSFTLPVMQP